MKPGTWVTKTEILPDTRPHRYETFEHNRHTAPLTYKKQGKVLKTDWSRKEALVHWANGVRSWERFENLEEI